MKQVQQEQTGDGMCPEETAAVRYEEQDCNAADCANDEICVAVQDLVIAVDGSMAVNPDDFENVRTFIGQLLDRYETSHNNEAAMQIGVIVFGSGAIKDDGGIADAVTVSELSDDISALKTAVEDTTDMKVQGGFTNLAQGYALALKLLNDKGRNGAQSAVMTISFATPSTMLDTLRINKEMKDAGISLFNIGIVESENSDEWKLMQDLASQPADRNTLAIPLDGLNDETSREDQVQAAIKSFCPTAISPEP
jgi:hypothetical protein